MVLGAPQAPLVSQAAQAHRPVMAQTRAATLMVPGASQAAGGRNPIPGGGGAIPAGAAAPNQCQAAWAPPAGISPAPLAALTTASAAGSAAPGVRPGGLMIS